MVTLRRGILNTVEDLTLSKVLYVAYLRKSFVSGWLLKKAGFRLVFESDKFVLSRRGFYVVKGYAQNVMFKLNDFFFPTPTSPIPSSYPNFAMHDEFVDNPTHPAPHPNPLPPFNSNPLAPSANNPTHPAPSPNHPSVTQILNATAIKPTPARSLHKRPRTKSPILKNQPVFPSSLNLNFPPPANLYTSPPPSPKSFPPPPPNPFSQPGVETIPETQPDPSIEPPPQPQNNSEPVLSASAEETQSNPSIEPPPQPQNNSKPVLSDSSEEKEATLNIAVDSEVADTLHVASVLGLDVENHLNPLVNEIVGEGANDVHP